MMQDVEKPVSLTSEGEAIRHLKQTIAEGKHWYLALLEAVGLWEKVEEKHQGRLYRYLVGGEAFDWLLLAERLAQEVDGLIPEEEKEELLLYGRPPLELLAEELRNLLGPEKYRAYLNYFYGVVVEEALHLVVEEEVLKERRSRGYAGDLGPSEEEAFLRIYGAPRARLLAQFRQERGYPERQDMDLDELKEFTYWLFKYRLKECPKPRVASDTRKGLGQLRRMRTQRDLRYREEDSTTETP